MPDFSAVLSAAARGDPRAVAELLPLVYDELRALAAAKMAAEPAGHTLDATALVHEAYLRLVGAGEGRGWSDKAHFLAVAAQAMRRVLVDHARKRLRLKRGGGRRAVPLDGLPAPAPDDDLVALDEALDALAAEDPAKARLVELRYFAGMAEAEAADALGISRATAARHWAYARAWLYDRLRNPVGR
jgi:RNA polymerase sigma factor (TIGR02999 family)